MKSSRGFAISILIVIAAARVMLAQWPKYPTADVPKNPDGKPNLEAPAPRTADGKPDRPAHRSSISKFRPSIRKRCGRRL
jgi:hypothetical protein